jgi:hypothetical protein
LEGVSICLSHDQNLDIVAIDGVSLICPIGAESDPYEFQAKIVRNMIEHGIITSGTINARGIPFKRITRNSDGVFVMTDIPEG